MARKRAKVLGAWPDTERWSPRCTMTLQLVADRSKLESSRVALVADFVLTQATFLAGDEARLRHEVLATATELLENAVKYAASEDDMVTVELTCYRGTVCVESRNRASRAAVDRLAEVFRRLATEDPVELLLEQLERTAREDVDASGIGLLKLRAEFDLGLGVCVEALGPDNVTVCTRAFISTRGVAA